jgi:hypothetical protein
MQGVESKFELLTKVAAASEKIPEPPLPKPLALSSKSVSEPGRSLGSAVSSIGSVGNSTPTMLVDYLFFSFLIH